MRFWDNFKLYKFKSILFVNFAYALVFAMIPIIVINIFTYKYYTESSAAEILKSHQSSTIIGRNAVDNIFVMADKLFLILSNNKEIKNFIYRKYSSSYEYYTEVKKIVGIINEYASYYDMIKAIRIYSSVSDYVVASDEGGGTSDKFSYPDWRTEFSENIEIKGSWVGRIYGYGTDNPSFDSFVPIYSVVPVTEFEKKGIILVSISKSAIARALGISREAQGRTSIVMRDHIIYDDNNIAGADIISEEEIIEQCSAGEHSETVSRGGKVYVVSVVKSDYNSAMMFRMSSAEGFNERLNSWHKYVAGIILFELAALLVVAFLISSRTYGPIKEIIEVLESEMPLNYDNKNKGYGEMKYISNKILNVKNVAAEMSDQLLMNTLKLRRAQAIALQAQIKPHFIFNTLENIRWKVIALTGGENPGSDMIGELAALMRLMLKTEGNFENIEFELEYVGLYLSLLEKRYDDMFTVQWNIDDNLRRCKTIKMVLQPIVENTIYHGIKPGNRHGLIKISIYEQGGNLVMSVADNGIGMTEERLCQVRGYLNAEKIKEGDNVGLANIDYRVKLGFGDSYGIEIQSKEGEGCEVRVVIPKIR